MKEAFFSSLLSNKYFHKKNKAERIIDNNQLNSLKFQTQTMRPIHVLLVEDNEGDILLTKEAFENSKVTNQLSVVKDGQEAIYFLTKEGNYSEAGTPDFLLLDVNLPKRNGFEVLKFIKEHNGLKHIPVIMLSTSSSPKDINQSYQNYANCFITKPGNADKYFDLISRIEKFWVSVATLPTINK